jgi:hypothetical protein
MSSLPSKEEFVAAHVAIQRLSGGRLASGVSSEEEEIKLAEATWELVAHPTAKDNLEFIDSLSEICESVCSRTV